MGRGKEGALPPPLGVSPGEHTLESKSWGHVCVTTRLGGFVSPLFVTSWTGLMTMGLEPGDSWLPPPIRVPQHLAANLAAKYFLEGTADTLCYVDDDHEFLPDTLRRLRNDPEGQAYDILQAVYVARRSNKPVVLTIREEPPSVRDAALYNWETDWKRGDIVKVDGIGLGFTLVRREVLETVIERWGPQAFEFGTGRTYVATEDLIFSNKVRALGCTMAVHTGVEVKHIQEVAIGLDDVIPKESTPNAV